MSTVTPLRVFPMPEGKNEKGKNEGGVAVYIGTGESDKQEFGRVAYKRNGSSNPKIPFDEMLKKTLSDAEALVAEVNKRWSELQDGQTGEDPGLAKSITDAAEQAHKVRGDAASAMAAVQTQTGNEISRLRAEATAKIEKARMEAVTKLNKLDEQIAEKIKSVTDARQAVVADVIAEVTKSSQGKML